MKKVLILVEGQTEETIVRDVLDPHLQQRGIALQAVILKTKRVKSGQTFKGGVTSYAKIQGDIQALLRDSSAAAITTLIDYYGLPDDFPGLGDRPMAGPVQRVQHVENAFQASVNHARFLPHLTLHEMEAWVFAAPEKCAGIFSDRRIADQLTQIRDQCGGPEAVNEGPGTAPSKRISALATDYQKSFHGPLAIMEIGIDHIRQKCPHADAWLQKLESLYSRP